MEKSKGSAKGAGKQVRPGQEKPSTNIQRQQGENIQQPGEQLKQKQQQPGKQSKKTSR